MISEINQNKIKKRKKKEKKGKKNKKTKKTKIELTGIKFHFLVLSQSP